MKKGIKLLTCGVICMSAFAWKVNAEEVNVADLTSLENCVSTKNVCKLSQDITVTSPVEILDEVTIDLNGYTIDANTDNYGSLDDAVLIVRRGSTLTIEDSSTTKTGKVDGNNEDINATIKLTKKGENDSTNAANLIVNSGNIEGKDFAISGNGSRNNTNITINGGKIVSSSATAIYHPQSGTLTVNGGTIEGTTGIEMRSGDLIVNGGTIRGTYIPTEVNANDNGSTTEGAGVAIAQHNTEQGINVTINGGTLEGYTALYESNPQNNEEAAVKQIVINITGGTFNAINGGTTSVYSENLTGFITNGTFNTKITSEYLDSTYTLVEENGVFSVAKKEIKYDVVKGENQEVKIEEGKEITFTIDADYTLFDKLYIDGKEVPKEYYTVKSGSTIITINAEYAKTLSAGNHELKVTFTDGGSATTAFTMVSEVANPKTADNIISYMLLSILSAIGLITVSKNISKTKKAN